MDGESAHTHILVCDDDPAIRVVFEDFLTDEGYRVTVQASLGADVHDVIVLAPDLIVLDLIFNGRPIGFEFLQRLKATPATQAIPVLTCTAAVVDEDIQQKLTTWGSRSLIKSFDLDELLAAVQDCLGTTEIAV